ncbi:MAG: DUF2182 domain-containing protein [Pseudomonadota bacterium]|nr:DUF2182 domain-containing protein [Pseudomonadota bacterium]
MPAASELLRRLPALGNPGPLLWVAATLATIAGSLSMQDMGEVPMPGGWTLSTTWMPMCGQSWAGAAASFTGMWVVMMVAMMLPAVLPQLRYRRPASAMAAGAGYFFVWTVLGVIIFALGAVLTQALLQLNTVARTVPVLSGLVVLLAGVFQFTRWKARHLACCRQPITRLPTQAMAAWHHGLQLGIHCMCSCAGLTTLLLVLGVMNLHVMAIVTAAITSERWAHDGERVARITGAVMVVTSLLLIGRAVGAG